MTYRQFTFGAVGEPDLTVHGGYGGDDGGGIGQLLALVVLIGAAPVHGAGHAPSGSPPGSAQLNTAWLASL